MLNSRRWMLGLFAAVAIAALAFGGGAGAQDTPSRALRIAVVNMSDCTEAAQNEHAKELSAQFDAISKQARDEVAAIKKKAEEYRSQAKSLEESGAGSPLYLELVRKWQMEEANLKIVGDLNQRKLVAARDSFKNMLYSDARKMASLLAQEMKIDLVLRSDDGAFEEDKSEMALQRNLLRSVLYHDPGIDLTKAVIGRLNDDFKKRKGAAPGECPNCRIAGKDGKCPKCGAALKN